MNNQPLADRLRPTSFDDIAGQRHLVGKNGIIRKLTDAGRIPNMIFYGPPGTGKTTIANIIAKALGLKDVKLHLNSLGDDESRDAYRAALQEHFKDCLDDLCY